LIPCALRLRLEQSCNDRSIYAALPRRYLLDLACLAVALRLALIRVSARCFCGMIFNFIDLSYAK